MLSYRRTFRHYRSISTWRASGFDHSIHLLLMVTVHCFWSLPEETHFRGGTLACTAGYGRFSSICIACSRFYVRSLCQSIASGTHRFRSLFGSLTVSSFKMMGLEREGMGGGWEQLSSLGCVLTSNCNALNWLLPILSHFCLASL